LLTVGLSDVRAVSADDVSGDVSFDDLRYNLEPLCSKGF
jgi:hypothetical protein